MKSVFPYYYFDYPTKTYVEVYSPQNPQLMALYPLGADVTDAETLATNKYYVNTSESAISVSGVDITAVTMNVADIMYLKSGTPVVAEIVGNLKSSSSASSGNGGSAVEVLFEAKTVEEEVNLNGYTMSNVTSGTYVFDIACTYNDIRRCCTIQVDVNDRDKYYCMCCNMSTGRRFACVTFYMTVTDGDVTGIRNETYDFTTMGDVSLTFNLIKCYKIR